MKSILKQIYQNSKFDNSEVMQLIIDSFDENVIIRWSIARKSKTPISVLKKLSEDEDWHIREGVALNTKTPASILEKLSEDESEDVRRGVAKNLNAPIFTLRKLYKESRYMRYSVINNPTYKKYHKFEWVKTIYEWVSRSFTKS